jgi:predicted flap endonuclease-1-like 5' DNA nuclease
MKKLMKLIVFLGVVAAVGYALRDRLMPPPQAPSSSPPPFRTTDDGHSVLAQGADDLQRINGIGPVRVQQLGDIGVTGFAELADADAVDLAAKLGVSVAQTEDWIEQAADLA